MRRSRECIRRGATAITFARLRVGIQFQQLSPWKELKSLALGTYGHSMARCVDWSICAMREPANHVWIWQCARICPNITVMSKKPPAQIVRANSAERCVSTPRRRPDLRASDSGRCRMTPLMACRVDARANATTVDRIASARLLWIGAL